MFEQNPIPLALVAVEGEARFVAASRGFLDTFDLRRSTVAGRPVDELLVAQSGEGPAGAILGGLAAADEFRIKVEARGRGGRRFVRVLARPAPGFEGHILLEAEGHGHAVHSVAHRLASLFDQAGGEGPTMTYLHDLRRQRLRYADGDLSRRLAFPPEGMPLSDLLARVHPDDLADHAARESAQDRLSDDEFTTRILRVRDATGEWRLISLRVRVLRRGRGGVPRLLLGTATDITDYAAAVGEATGVSVLRAEENERARIGRELHDSTQQHLVAADLGLSRVLRTGEFSAEVRERLQGVQESLAQAQAEMRAFAYFLHPPELRDLGLFKAVEKFCAGFARRSDLEIVFKAGPPPAEISSEAEHALFRVCQEALMNVYRHAFARRVSVRLQLGDGQLILEVRDDGIGVDGVDRFEHGGMGVAGMRSRMKSVGGELILDYLGPGLSVTARAPLAPAAGRARPAARRPASQPEAIEPPGWARPGEAEPAEARRVRSFNSDQPGRSPRERPTS